MRHEGEGEFHAGKEEDEGEVGEIEESVGVGTLVWCGHGFGRVFLLGVCIGFGLRIGMTVRFPVGFEGFNGCRGCE